VQLDWMNSFTSFYF